MLTLEGRRFSGSLNKTVKWDIQQISTSNGADSGRLRFYGFYDVTRTPLFDFIDNGGSPPIAAANGTPSTYIEYGNNMVISSNGGFILSGGDVTNVLGSGGNRWLSSWIRSYYGVQQNVTSNGAITLNPTLGDVYKLTANGNVTGLTISTGTYDGQTIKVILVQDAGATSTWTTTFTNASLAGGTFTKTVTASAIDTLTFTYDSNSTKWREMSRSLNLS